MPTQIPETHVPTEILPTIAPETTLPTTQSPTSSPINKSEKGVSPGYLGLVFVVGLALGALSVALVLYLVKLKRNKSNVSNLNDVSLENSD